MFHIWRVSLVMNEEEDVTSTLLLLKAKFTSWSHRRRAQTLVGDFKDHKTDEQLSPLPNGATS